MVVHRVAVILQTFKVSAFLQGRSRPCSSSLNSLVWGSGSAHSGLGLGLSWCQGLWVPATLRPFSSKLTKAWDQCAEGLKRRCQNPAPTAVLGAQQHSGLQEDGWKDKVRWEGTEEWEAPSLPQDLVMGSQICSGGAD